MPMPSDYWYDNKHLLRADMVFQCSDGSIIRLDRRIPGDGTEWYALEWIDGRWCAEDLTVHPGDFLEQLDAPSHTQSSSKASIDNTQNGKAQ